MGTKMSKAKKAKADKGKAAAGADYDESGEQAVGTNPGLPTDL
jgi:hypothetical protein